MSWYRETAILSLLLMLCISLYAIRSYLTDVLYTATPDYLQTQQKIQNLHNQNLELEDQVLENESYTKIASIAANEGFVPAVFITP